MADYVTPLKAIRKKCLECCCGSSEEVKLCHIERCSLHPFRFGKNPFLAKRNYTEEQREAMADRLSNIRRSKN